jgi:hypothetical protein
MHPARYAVDGNPATRWSSRFHEPEWITVDLGTVSDIARVRLLWEEAYAKEYQLQVSDDAAAWATVASVTEGDGGIDEHAVSARGRYVRMHGVKRSTPYGLSLWELEVYAPGAPEGSASTLLSAGRPVIVSSVESIGMWALYWPLFMIAGGLPMVIAPKDAGAQIVGLVMVGVGLFLQLSALRIVTWSFGDMLPFVLILAGLLMVIQSLRKADGGNGEPKTSSETVA